MSSCPTNETLARLGHDSLDGPEGDAIEGHVQHCAQCVGILEKLVADDTATAPPLASLPAEESLPAIPGFDIECELGRGGMGAVYRAWEPKLARTVALKIVPSGPMTGRARESAGSLKRNASPGFTTRTSSRFMMRPRRTGGCTWCWNSCREGA